MNWADQMFGYGMDPELRKRLTEQQRMQLGSGALMDAGLALLANSGYSRTPITAGQALAQGIGAGRQSYAQNMQGMQAQIEAQRQAEQEAQQRQTILGGMSPDIQRFAAGLDLPSLRSMAVGMGKEMAKPQKPEARTSLQKEAEQLFPGDNKAQAAWIREQRAKPTGTTVNVGTGAAPADPLSRIVTPDQRAALNRAGVRLQDGIEYAWDKNNVPQPIKGTEPTKAEQAAQAKAPQIENATVLLNQMQAALENGLGTGWWNAPAGIPVGRMMSQEKEQFDSVKEQLSSQIRAIFRIPGEGTLSDKEQAQYGLTLPSLDKRPETNRVLIENLRQMISSYGGGQAGTIVPNSSAAQGGWRVVGVE